MLYYKLMNSPKKPRAKRERKPKHAVTVRAYRFPLEPTKAVFEKLFAIKNLCWELRNLLVTERAANRAANRPVKEAGLPTAYLTRKDQYTRVALLPKTDARFAQVYSQVLQDVACRVDEGTRRWLESLVSGRKHVAPPGPILQKDYKSFTFPQYGSAARIKRGMLHLSKIGDIPVRDYRKMRGKPKTVTVKFEDGRWWAIVTCEIQPASLFRSAKDVANLPDIGADPGLTSLLTMADGTVFDPPRALKLRLKDLRHAQRDMSRKFEMRKSEYAKEQGRRAAAGEDLLPSLRELPYSNRLKAQIKKVAKIYTDVKNMRRHHHDKIARTIERTYCLVAVEEHGVLFMLANKRMAKSAADRGIAAQKDALKSVLGPRYVPTANRRAGIGGNSQTCLCGAAVPKDLTVRVHDCPVCGLVASRDTVSANIVMQMAFGKSLLMTPKIQAIATQTAALREALAAELRETAAKLTKEAKAAKALTASTAKSAKKRALDAQQRNNEAAGLAVSGLKTDIRGGVKRAKTGEVPVQPPVAKQFVATETSVKRKPVLPEGRVTGGGEPAPAAKTSRALLEQMSAALPVCGDHTPGFLTKSALMATVQRGLLGLPGSTVL